LLLVLLQENGGDSQTSGDELGKRAPIHGSGTLTVANFFERS
jgi:hypothetical protein